MDVLEQLTTPECWSLLGDHEVGRVAFTERALPTIAPVTYTLIGNELVLRCASDRQAAQLDGQVVAFQVDDVDPATGARRSVVMTGTTERLAGLPGGAGRTGTEPAVRLNAGRLCGQRVIHAT